MKKQTLLFIIISGSLINSFSQHGDIPPELIGGLDSLHKIIEYPQFKSDTIKGKVILLAYLNDEGELDSAIVLNSLGKPFNDEAIKKIKLMKYVPAYNHHVKRSIKSTLLIPVFFPPEIYYNRRKN